jgi:hypothetical protein
MLVAASLVAALLSAGPAMAEPAALTPAQVKYYTVLASYRDAPENLDEIAGRFLGISTRAIDIYRLNAGRLQADNHALTDGDDLHPGWILILPWDAIGDGVEIGVPPGTGNGGPAGPQAQPSGTVPGGSAGQGDAGRCIGVATAARTESYWAYERMAAGRAWNRTRGEGVLVGLADSGVDATVAQLSGRVTPGANIASGASRGDVDCLGTGTAMASIIAARPDIDTAQAGGVVVGMAPGSVILPLRVVGDTPTSDPARTAAAIEVAVSAGAKVIALGGYVDASNEATIAAIRVAIDHDVVVIAPALTNPGPEHTLRTEGLLWVGGIGPDGQQAADYLACGVDIVAPGIDVATLTMGGARARSSSGSQYAVAFVAGTAALVRSAFPDLSAAQVTRRIKATVDRAATAPAGDGGAWGMVNASNAVTAQLDDGDRTADAPGRINPWAVIGLMLLVAGIATVVLIARQRQPRAERPPAPTFTGRAQVVPGGSPSEPRAET